MKSKQCLSNLVAGQPVAVDWHKLDRYGRIVGKIIDHERDANLAMVRAGLAWWYRKYANEQTAADQMLYEDAEARVRTRKIGLSRDADPLPLWEWRHRR